MTSKKDFVSDIVPMHEKLFLVAKSIGMKNVEVFSSNSSNKKTVYVKKDDGSTGPFELIDDPREYMPIAKRFKVSFVWDGPLEKIIATMPTKHGCRIGYGENYGESILNCLHDHFSRCGNHA